MKQYQLTGSSGLGEFGISRRNVLRAVGVTAVAGGMFTGSAWADSRPGNDCLSAYPNEDLDEGCMWQRADASDLEAGTLIYDGNGIKLTLKADEREENSIVEYEIEAGTEIRALRLFGGSIGCHSLQENLTGSGSVRTDQQGTTGTGVAIHPDVSHVDFIVCVAPVDECECPSELEGVKFEFEDGRFVAEDGTVPEDYGLTLEPVDGDAKEVRVLSTEEDCEFSLVAYVKAGNADNTQEVDTGESIYGIDVVNQKGKTVVNAISHVHLRVRVNTRQVRQLPRRIASVVRSGERGR